MSVLFLSTDLVFSSRLTATGRRLGVTVSTAASLDSAVAWLKNDLIELVVIDLSLANLDAKKAVSQLRAIRQPLTVVAYAPHVHENLLRDATEAGCDLVLTRGQFDRQMDEILRAPGGKK